MGSPPPTVRGDLVDVLHGIDVADPYRWLEDTDDPGVRAWVDAQNGHTESLLSSLPSRDGWRRRVLEHLRRPIVSAAQLRDGVVVALERDEGADQAVLTWQRLAAGTTSAGATTVLVDVTTDGDETAAIDWFEASPDGGRIAYGTSSGGTMSLQLLSAGRFRLGLGTSGPQVMEGWHGVRFDAPLAATRETIEILRAVSRGDRLEHDGEVYQLPLPGGQGRAIRSMLEPTDVPIYVAALGPKNLALTGELADGWLGNAFIPDSAETFLEPLRAGAARAGRDVNDLDIVIPVAVEFTEDVDEAARRHARGYAFTIGAMGSRSTNFYNRAFARQGFADDVAAVQELWLAGRREEAAERVPIELGMKTNLIGTPAMVTERLRRYRAAGVTTLQAKLGGDRTEQLDTLAQLIDLTDELV